MRLAIKWKNGWAHAHGTGPDGRRIRQSLKTQDHRRAEEARASLEARLWRASVYGADAVVTFDQAALAYAQDGGDTRFLVRMSEALQGIRLRDITPRMVREEARKAYPAASPATVNRQGITPVRAVINYGHDQGWCAPIKVKGLPVPKPIKRAVGDDYLAALQPQLPPRLFALMLFLYTTGRRLGDAIGLQVQDIDLDAGTAMIRRTKTGTTVIAPVVPLVRDLLKDHMPATGPAFGYASRHNVYGTLKRACKRAGVDYLGTHQPGRHSFATNLDQAGLSAAQIADAGGWASVRLVSETYTHPNNSAKIAADIIGKNLAKRLSA